MGGESPPPRRGNVVVAWWHVFAWHAAAAWPALSKTLLTKPPNRGIRKGKLKYAKYATATAKKMRVFRSVFDSIKESGGGGGGALIELWWVLLGFWLSKEKPQYFTRPPK